MNRTVRHKVICTAGHIDHGKTSLVRALTGMDTDRLSEEKIRGITIDLGFGFYGDDATIIDLPGHERFIRNMAAGAATVDFALLTVAADDGPMPQTIEHLDILNLLGVKEGMIVVTKADLVDEGWLELVLEEVKEKAAGTFLEGKPALAVDSISGRGIEDFRRALDEALAGLPPRPESPDYRQPVDRSFTIKGFGTVITGTVVSGRVSLKDTVELLPRKKALKVRGIQVHGREVESAETGTRAALNLSGIEKREIERGDVLAKPGLLRPADRLDCRIELLKTSPTLKHRQRLRFHLGTAEIIGRILLLEGNLLQPGESMFAQLELEKPASALRGDRFVFRTYSPQTTIGGGEVLMNADEKHKRRQPRLLNLFASIAGGDVKAITTGLLSNADLTGMTVEEISHRGGVRENEIALTIQSLAGDNKVTSARSGGKDWSILTEGMEENRQRILSFAENFHHSRPSLPGFSLAQLKGELKWDSESPFLELALEELVSGGEMNRSGSLYSLPGHSIKLTPRQREMAEKILKMLDKTGLSALKAHPIAETLEVEVEEILDLLAIMESMGDIVRLDRDAVLSTQVYRDAVDKMKAAAAEIGAITLQEAVKILNSSRRVTVALLEHLDRTGITERNGDERRFK